MDIMKPIVCFLYLFTLKFHIIKENEVENLVVLVHQPDLFHHSF